MNRMMYLGIATVALLGCVAFAAYAQLFTQRPTALSTGMTSSAYEPASFRLVINGQQLAARRMDTLNDGGGAPYTSLLQRTFEIEADWIEAFTQKAYRVSVSVPVVALSAVGKDKDHVLLYLEIGKNGAFQVRTSHPELGRYLEENRQSEITPEMDQQVIILTACGTPVLPDDLAYAEMLTWLDEADMQRARDIRDAALVRDPNGSSQLTCKE